jgi:hypothetical protein
MMMGVCMRDAGAAQGAATCRHKNEAGRKKKKAKVWSARLAQVSRSLVLLRLLSAEECKLLE